MKTSVYIVKCDSYEKADEKLLNLISLMGGMGQFAKPGEKITLKVNLLSSTAPEKAVTTHPAIVSAVGKMAKKEGAIPLIADSSGGPYNEGTLKKIYTTCKMYDAARLAGIEVNMDTGHDEVSFPEGKELKKMDVIKPITQADGVFNLCKMKTHALMHMTGAVKNHFGILPGLSKVGFHAKLFKKDRFADMLLDLALYVSPRLSIMDAVLALEGEGPGASGTPRNVGLILASTNPLALDVVASEIMGLPHELNPVLLAAERRGLKPNRIEDVDVIGEELSTLIIPDYKFTKTVESLRAKNGNNTSREKKLYPVVIKEKCIGCGVCANSCPQKTITMTTSQGKKQAFINTKNCIRCYCCHELCPNKAIKIDTKRNPISKILKM
ncbi:MAG: DUF362 domain-containing protein [Oscillospiraceae bacterium]|nr:DUF362 domain-containing protein [Oscillospiraceae bacterium]